MLYEYAYYHLAGRQQWADMKNLVPGAYNNDASIQSITLLRRLGQNYFQEGAMGMSHTAAQMQFFNGRAAMIPCGSWLKSEMKGKIPDGFELGFFNLPLPPGHKADPSTINAHVEPFYLMSHSKHPREAVDFLRFMTSKAQAGKFARMQDIVVAVRGANEGNLSPDLNDMLAIVSQAKASFGDVPGGGYPDMWQVDTDAMYKVLRGIGTPQEVGQWMEDRAAALRNQKLNPTRVDVHHVWKPVILIAVLGLGFVYAVFQTGRRLRLSGPARTKNAETLPRMRFSNVLLFLLPSVAIYSLFVIVPSARSFSWSLHSWNGLTNMSQMPLVGLLNFKRLLLESDAFWTALLNNLFLMTVVPLFVIPLALFLAACISRGIWGANAFRVIFFFPNLLGSVAATLLWLHLYNPQGGLVNAALVGIGLDHFSGFTWLESKHLYWALVPISIWGACGFNMVLYLAAMQSIPESYYEAAKLDGASQWRQFWTITVPLIWEILAISLVFLVIGGMKAFDVIWLLKNQRPQTQEHVIGTLMVQTMFQEYNVGQATAIAVMLFFMVFVGSALTLRVMRRETVEM
jgi:raffinose/stachyose/melibiose transport system permease protein